MTWARAFAKAKRQAKKTKEWYYIVYESGEYNVASETEVDTFWEGAKIISAIGPDGSCEC